MALATLSAGHVPTAAELAAYKAQIDSLTAPGWTSYTPTWIGSTTNPAIGNGTRSGRWRRPADSDLVHFQILIIMGSTTTYGSGFWSLGFPTSPAPSATAQTFFTGPCLLVDNSAAGRFPGVPDVFSGAIILGTTGGGAVAPTVPFTWAQNDRIVIDGWYQPA